MSKPLQVPDARDYNFFNQNECTDEMEILANRSGGSRFSEFKIPISSRHQNDPPTRGLWH